MRIMWVVLAIALAAPVFSQPVKVSRDARELGPIVMRELSINQGKLAFRVDSNGCTDASSFKVSVGKEEGVSPASPHYRLMVERTRIDECKAMLWDGVVIELDLEKDLHLSGRYTISVENPVLAKSGMGQ